MIFFIFLIDLHVSQMSSKIANILSEIVREIFDKPTGKIPLHVPYLKKDVIEKYLHKVYASGNVSGGGNLTTLFEKKLVEFTGSPYVLAVNSGTSALHLGLLALEIPAGSEVLIPSLSYVAPTNAVLYVGAVPHFIEVNENLGIDADLLEEYLNKNVVVKAGKSYNKETGRHISALLGVHTLGFPLEIGRILQICRKYNLFFIEDAAQAFGSKYKGQFLGTFGDTGIMSFNGTKTLTTGSGGALLTKNVEVYKRALHLARVAKLPEKHRYLHDTLGYNYRLPAWNAALGLAQLEYIEEIFQRKSEIKKRYNTLLPGFEEFSLVHSLNNEEIVPWLFSLKLPFQTTHQEQEDILKFLNTLGIEARAIWSPLHGFEYLRTFPRMKLSRSEFLKTKIINLPGGL